MKYQNKKDNSLFLEIDHCDFTDSPREWTNLGYFITIERDDNIPDDNKILRNIIDNTQDEVNNSGEHMESIKREYEETTDEKVIAIYPIVKYEHGGVVYSLGEKHGFDYSNCGFYVITDKTQEEVGTSKKDFEKVIEDELNIYNKWVNGEVYQGLHYKEIICKECGYSHNETIDSIGGCYSEEEIFDNIGLNINDYELIN